MNVDEAADVWRSLKDYISAKDKQSAADQFVMMIAESGMEEQDLWALADVDHHLEVAVQEALGHIEEEEHVDDDEWDER